MQAGGRATLILFVLFQALYGLTSSGNAFRVPDEFEVYFQTEHLVDAGDISVPQTLDIRMRGDQPIFFGRVGRDRKPYAPYGPLVAILAVPQHLVARAVHVADRCAALAAAGGPCLGPAGQRVDDDRVSDGCSAGRRRVSPCGTGNRQHRRGLR